MPYNLKGDVTVQRRLDAGILGVPDWVTGTDYQEGDLVLEGGVVYASGSVHTAGATFAGDAVNWSEASGGGGESRRPWTTVDLAAPGDQTNLPVGDPAGTAYEYVNAPVAGEAIGAANPITVYSGDILEVAAGVTASTNDGADWVRIPRQGGIYGGSGNLTGQTVVNLLTHDLLLGTSRFRPTGINEATGWEVDTTSFAVVDATPLTPGGAGRIVMSFSNASTGDLTINAPTGVANSTLMIIVLSNSDTVARNAIFDAVYLDQAGAAIGTVSVPAGEEVEFRFSAGLGAGIGSWYRSTSAAAPPVSDELNSASAIVNSTQATLTFADGDITVDDPNSVETHAAVTVDATAVGGSATHPAIQIDPGYSDLDLTAPTVVVEGHDLVVYFDNAAAGDVFTATNANAAVTGVAGAGTYSAGAVTADGTGIVGVRISAPAGGRLQLALNGPGNPAYFAALVEAIPTSIYSANGALDGDRAVTMGGNDLTLSGAQDTVLRDVGVHDAVAWCKATGGGLFGAGTVAPDLSVASNFNWGIASTDVGDLNVGNPVVGLTGNAVEYILSFSNTDLVARNVVFSSHYTDRDGTPLGTQVVAASSHLHFHFTYESGVFAGSYLDHVLAAASDVTSTVIDSSAGAVAETLPAATGSGVIRFYANEDVTNTATLAPAAGEQLNGVVDASFLFSNYAAGTQFRADDIATGQWVVSVVGATSTTDPVKTAPLTELTSPSHTLTTGANPASGTVSINSIRYIDEGASFRRVYLDLYSFEDDPTELQLGAGVIPATASIRTAYATHGNGSSVENSANHRPSVYISDTNEITVNRDDSAQSGVTPIGIVLTVEDTANSFSGGEVVLAGMVAPESLHHAWVGRSDSTGSTSLTFSPGLVPVGDAYFDRYDPNGLVQADSFTVTQDGVYEVTMAPAMNSTTSQQQQMIRVDGVVVSSSLIDVPTSAEGPSPIFWVGDLTAGQAVTFDFQVATGPLYGGSFSIRQQPTSIVVMPDALVPESLHSFSVAGAWSLSGTDHQIGLAAVIHDPHSLLDNHTVVIQQAGNYAINGFVEAGTGYSDLDIHINGVLSNSNGGSPFAAGDTHGVAVSVVFPLNVGDVLSFRSSGGSTNRGSISIVQLPTLEVVTPGSTPVNDQISSGYFDIGNMRIQSGRATSSGGNVTVAFPMPFKDTTYSLVGTAANGADVNVTYDTDTTTGATFRTQETSGAGTNTSFSWQAIGEKP
mgnify:FL=1